MCKAARHPGEDHILLLYYSGQSVLHQIHGTTSWELQLQDLTLSYLVQRIGREITEKRGGSLKLA
jgi:hypothetical protein